MDLPSALDLAGVSCAEGGLLPPEFVAEALEGLLSHPEWLGFWVLVDDLVIGSGIFKSAPIDGTVEIGYGVSPLHEGKGAATALVAELVATARQKGAQVVRIQTLADTVASQRVAIKNGFEYVGVFEDPDDGLVWRYELPLA